MRLPPIFSVEWAPNGGLVHVLPQLQPAACRFVLPDLPEVYNEDDLVQFRQHTAPNQRIHTLAACRHENHQSLLDAVEKVDETSTILLVGGNDKSSSSTMSTMEATKILQNEMPNAVWGVANPNDADSLDGVYRKAKAGISGIITQPLLASTAHEMLQRYKTEVDKDLTVLAGMAFPTTARSLQFWARLLEQEEFLQKDPLFQSHLAFFSQPYYQPIAWTGREFQELLMMTSMRSLDGSTTTTTTPTIDGIHCMPLKNTEDLCTIFQSLNANMTSFDKQ